MAANRSRLRRSLKSCRFVGFEPLEERLALSTVVNVNDSGPGSLRDTIAAAVSGDTIVFDLPTPDTIILTTAGLLIDKDLTITGPGADNLTIARSSANGTRHSSSSISHKAPSPSVA